jgi:hypothetical protein
MIIRPQPSHPIVRPASCERGGVEGAHGRSIGRPEAEMGTARGFDGALCRDCELERNRNRTRGLRSRANAPVLVGAAWRHRSDGCVPVRRHRARHDRALCLSCVPVPAAEATGVAKHCAGKKRRR